MSREEVCSVPQYVFLRNQWVIYVGGVGIKSDHHSYQDRIFAYDNCFAIADGATTANGELAARMAIRSINRMGAVQYKEECRYPITDVVEAANRRIYRWKKRQQRVWSSYQIATTLVLLRLNEKEGIMYREHADIGDCSLFYGNWKTGKKLEELAEEHTIWSKMIATGEQLPIEDRKIRVAKSTLARYLGREPTTPAHYEQRKVEIGDIFFLCSDGIRKGISRNELKELIYDGLEAEKSEEAIAREISNVASICSDDLSALLVRVEQRSNP